MKLVKKEAAMKAMMQSTVDWRQSFEKPQGPVV